MPWWPILQAADLGIALLPVESHRLERRCGQLRADGPVYLGGLLGHVEKAGAVALPAQGLIDPEMVHLQPAQGDSP